MMCVGITCVLFVQAEYKCCSLMCALIDGIRFMVYARTAAIILPVQRANFKQEQEGRQAQAEQAPFWEFGILSSAPVLNPDSMKDTNS